MKFLEWIESIDHLLVPWTVDVGLSVFTAGLLTALLRFVFELAA
jgi:hypothetical protein